MEEEALLLQTSAWQMLHLVESAQHWQRDKVLLRRESTAPPSLGTGKQGQVVWYWVHSVDKGGFGFLVVLRLFRVSGCLQSEVASASLVV